MNLRTQKGRFQLSNYIRKPSWNWGNNSVTLFRNVYELCIAFPENHTMTLLKNIAQLFYESAMEIRQVKISSFLLLFL